MCRYGCSQILRLMKEVQLELKEQHKIGVNFLRACGFSCF